jgi:hypothetical protein
MHRPLDHAWGRPGLSVHNWILSSHCGFEEIDCAEELMVLRARPIT